MSYQRNLNTVFLIKVVLVALQDNNCESYSGLRSPGRSNLTYFWKNNKINNNNDDGNDLNSTLLDVKKETYVICTLHVSNNGQLNTLITIHKEVERDPPKKGKKKKRLPIVYTDKGTEESFTE